MIIPVIDFSVEKLKPGSESWICASKEVVYGLEEYGCVEIMYEKFPIELHNSIFDAAKQVLNLPEEAKKQKVSDRPGPKSYIVVNNNNHVADNDDHDDDHDDEAKDVPPFQNIAIDNPTTLQGAQSFTNIMWPQGNHNFCESVMCFSKRLEEIYEIVMRMVFEKYGVDQGDRFESFKNSSFHLLRMVKYKVREKGDSNVALIDHRDSTILSILHQNQINGLQIKTKNGHWIPVLKPNSTSSFIVLAGEGLMAWSNDRVRGCEHRVMLNDLMEMKNKERYSIALFTFINGVVDVPKEFVDDEHPLRYKPFDHFEFNRYYHHIDSPDHPQQPNNSLNPLIRRTIKTFCGI
ncbi:hypothetical protein CsatA_021802 [Cannabis sativa]